MGKVEYKGDWYKKGKLKGRKKFLEGNWPESEVDTLDYVPRSVRIKNAIMAGEKLRAYRDETNSSDEIAPDYRRNYDLTDAHADKQAADKAILEAAEKAKAEAAAKAEKEFNEKVEAEIAKRADSGNRTVSEPSE